MGSFVFRTTGFNSIRTLTARLNYLKAISNDMLSCMPLELRLRGKSTRMSRGTPIFYADITLREGMSMEQTLTAAAELYEQRERCGFNQKALDAVAKEGLLNGTFEEDEDDISAIVEEFYPTEIKANQDLKAHVLAERSLAEKLEKKARVKAEQT